MGSDREVVDNIYGAKGYEESEYVCEREEKNRQCAAYTETNGDKDQRGVYGRIPGGFRGAGRL